MAPAHPLALIVMVASAGSAVAQTASVEPAGGAAVGGRASVLEEERLDQEYDRDLILGDDAREQFSLHRLNYAAGGNDDLKIQLSFKYRFLEQIPAFVSFTNIVAWDVYEPKDPARDAIYNPEFFYRWRMDSPMPLLFDAGYWHASNGRGDEPEKRSLDRVFVRGLMDFEVFDRPLLLTPTGYVTVAESKYSPDIADYYGNFEIGLVWKNLLDPKTAGSDLDLMIDLVDPIWGEGSYTLGLQLRLEDYLWSPNLYVQYFRGYGDTLLEYDQHKSELRFGMTFYY